MPQWSGVGVGRRWPSPDKHIWVQVGPTWPFDRAAVHADGPKNGRIGTRGLEDRTPESIGEISLYDVPVGKGQPESVI